MNSSKKTESKSRSSPIPVKPGSDESPGRRLSQAIAAGAERLRQWLKGWGTFVFPD